MSNASLNVKENMDEPQDNELEPLKKSVEQSNQVPLLPDSTRRRKQTDKGRDYQIDVLTRNLSTSYSRVQRQCLLVIELLKSANVEIVQQESANLDKRLLEAEEFHSRLMGLLSEESQLEQQDKHETIDTEVFEVKRKTCEWLKDHDSASAAGSRVGSRASSRASSRSRGRPNSHASNNSISCVDSKGRTHVGSQVHSQAGSYTSKHSNHSNRSDSKLKLANLKAEEEALQQIQESKKEELECMLRLEKAKMESDRKRLQQKIIQAQLEDDILQTVERPQTTNTEKEKVKYLHQATRK